MNKYLNKILKWCCISMFGFSMVVLGQVGQVNIVSKSVTAHFVSEWVALDKSNEQTLQRYNSLCRNKPIDKQAFKEAMESPSFLTHEECALKANAMELYAVFQKANSITELSWPLSQF